MKYIYLLQDNLCFAEAVREYIFFSNNSTLMLQHIFGFEPGDPNLSEVGLSGVAAAVRVTISSYTWCTNKTCHGMLTSPKRCLHQCPRQTPILTQFGPCEKPKAALPDTHFTDKSYVVQRQSFSQMSLKIVSCLRSLHELLMPQRSCRETLTDEEVRNLDDARGDQAVA